METFETPLDAIAGVVERARSAYEVGRTRPVEWRIATLTRLRELLIAHEEEVLAALAEDLGKPRLEAWVTDVGYVVSDIDFTLAHLADWVRPEKVPTPLLFQPGSSRIQREPVGVACVIAPWNYPVQLSLAPVVAAVAAGNAVVVKPSEIAPATAVAVGRIVEKIGDDAVGVVQGGVAETTALLEQRFDHVFYTGNGKVGRIVMKAAAENLTPVTLELGGKSPTVVTRNARLDVAARRIAWGKFLNAGQTCIAPDYVLVESAVHDDFVAALTKTIRDFYGDQPSKSPDYARIVSSPHFHRLEKLLDCGTVAIGGDSDADSRFIAPTVLTGITPDDVVMEEEIFGPILPVLSVDSVDEAAALINGRDKPLALYVFTEDDDEAEQLIAATTSGGVCVNGTIFHIANPYLPFGGVGGSGMGAYHGQWGFETFSHRRAIHEKGTRLDPPLLYPPYSSVKEKTFRRASALPDPRDLTARLRQRIRRSST